MILFRLHGVFNVNLCTFEHEHVFVFAPSIKLTNCTDILAGHDVWVCLQRILVYKNVFHRCTLTIRECYRFPTDVNLVGLDFS